AERAAPLGQRQPVADPGRPGPARPVQEPERRPVAPLAEHHRATGYPRDGANGQRLDPPPLGRRILHRARPASTIRRRNRPAPRAASPSRPPADTPPRPAAAHPPGSAAPTA